MRVYVQNFQLIKKVHFLVCLIGLRNRWHVNNSICENKHCIMNII